VKLYRAASFYFNKIDGVSIGMDQFREKSGRYFFGSDIGKIFEDRGIHCG